MRPALLMGMLLAPLMPVPPWQLGRIFFSSLLRCFLAVILDSLLKNKLASMTPAQQVGNLHALSLLLTHCPTMFKQPDNPDGGLLNTLDQRLRQVRCCVSHCPVARACVGTTVWASRLVASAVVGACGCVVGGCRRRAGP